jgi:hypothetical protein
MRYVCCSIRRLTSFLIRPGSVVRIHNGPPKFIVDRTGISSTISPLGGSGIVQVSSALSPVPVASLIKLLIKVFLSARELSLSTLGKS